MAAKTQCDSRRNARVCPRGGTPVPAARAETAQNAPSRHRGSRVARCAAVGRSAAIRSGGLPHGRAGVALHGRVVAAFGRAPGARPARNGVDRLLPPGYGGTYDRIGSGYCPVSRGTSACSRPQGWRDKVGRDRAGLRRRARMRKSRHALCRISLTTEAKNAACLNRDLPGRGPLLCPGSQAWFRPRRGLLPTRPKCYNRRLRPYK